MPQTKPSSTKKLQDEMSYGSDKAYINNAFTKAERMQRLVDAADKHYKQNAYGHTALGGNYDPSGFAAYKEEQATAKYNRQKQEDTVTKAKEVRKKIKEYTKEGASDPDVRKYQKSYYRGDQGMKPRDPDESNPNDQQLRDLYEGSGKYYGYGATALGGTQSNSVPKDDRYRRGMNIKK
jgi:hypothetical protein